MVRNVFTHFRLGVRDNKGQQHGFVGSVYVRVAAFNSNCVGGIAAHITELATRSLPSAATSNRQCETSGRRCASSEGVPSYPVSVDPAIKGEGKPDDAKEEGPKPFDLCDVGVE